MIRVAQKITLKASRINSRLTILEIAEKIGCSASAVMSWESGEKEMGAKKFQKWCEITGFNACDFDLG